ncbi:MAG: nucleotidyltransferase family protein [Bryobacteraceae bacterium]
MPESASKTALVLLAAGSSSRMGCPKQLLSFRGQPLLRHAAETALEAGCSPVVVVLGANSEPLRSVLDGLPVDIRVNARWAEGMGTSIQTGLRALDRATVRGAILALADQPLVDAGFLRRLAYLHRLSGKPIIAARYAGTAGVPVFFARDRFPLLDALPARQGCKGVILGHPDDAMLVDCPEAEIDIDTPDDYAAAVATPSGGFRL